MSVRKNTPCLLDGICPYAAKQVSDCEYWCGIDAPCDHDGICPYDGDCKHWCGDEEECFEPGRPYISMFELNP